MSAPAREAYVDYHPGPADATAHFAEEAMRRAAGSPEAADGDRVSTSVSHIESPSVQIAWRLRMQEIGITLPLTTFFEAVQQPDPRTPKGQVDLVAWQYEGTQARPALGSPDPRAAQAVAAIAAQRYHLPTWADLAQSTAASFGSPWAQHLVATMLDPPPAPDHVHPLDWVPRVQVAAALVIAFGQEGYRTLYSLAIGPVDWVVDAAIVAIGELALRSPAVRPNAEPLLEWLCSQIPREGFTSYGYPLACTLLRLLAPHDPRRAEVMAWRDRILRGEEPGTTASGAIGVIDGLNMETYAEFCVRLEQIQMGGGGSVSQLAAEYGVPMIGGIHAYSTGWNEAINRDPRLGLAFAQTKARINLQMRGIDPDSDEARLSHNLMQGKGLDQEEEMRKAQAAHQQLAAGGGGDPDPVVFPGQAVAKLSDYVGLMKRMQTGDFNGALAAYGLNMGSYSQVMQAWGTKLGVDPTLNAKLGQMMAR
ncbi:MAG: hypothetical protein KC501_08700 [Myxococcales bacterium]|nr:hypothetical protein [Myxococcales bacterium]